MINMKTFKQQLEKPWKEQFDLWRLEFAQTFLLRVIYRFWNINASNLIQGEFYTYWVDLRPLLHLITRFLSNWNY